jgi:hypothetical protein
MKTNLILRTVASVMAAGCIMGGGAFAHDHGDKLNPDDAKDSLTIARKIQCSTIDDKPIVYSWHGQAFSRKQGERDKNIFNVVGMNIRACSAITDDNGNDGYHLVSREILLYTDTETGEALVTWDNPWTGETVDVMHVANDPVNFKSYTVGRDGKPATWRGEYGGGVWWQRSTFPLWYSNPLGGEFQTEVGGTYHATELFNFFGTTDDLFDASSDTAKVTVGWSRMSDWLPWMKMNGREGIFWVHTAGRKLDNFDELPEVMKEQIRLHYPEYDSPPPAGDPRPNMTSWKYYKGVKAGEIELPKR